LPPFELQRLAANGSLFITRPTLASLAARRTTGKLLLLPR
jgi:hypothetical protein